MPEEARVLLIESNEDHRQLFEYILSGAGFRVVASDHSPDALARVEPGGIAVAVLEWRLTPAANLPLLAQLRAWPRPPRIIVYSVDRGVDRIARAHGADGSFTKLDDSRRLVALVTELLGDEGEPETGARRQETGGEAVSGPALESDAV